MSNKRLSNREFLRSVQAYLSAEAGVRELDGRGKAGGNRRADSLLENTFYLEKGLSRLGELKAQLPSLLIHGEAG